MNDAIIMWLFAVVALELKHRAPKAHTMLVRHAAHISCVQPCLVPVVTSTAMSVAIVSYHSSLPEAHVVLGPAS